MTTLVIRLDMLCNPGGGLIKSVSLKGPVEIDEKQVVVSTKFTHVAVNSLQSPAGRNDGNNIGVCCRGSLARATRWIIGIGNQGDFRRENSPEIIHDVPEPVDEPGEGDLGKFRLLLNLLQQIISTDRQQHDDHVVRTASR